MPIQVSDVFQAPPLSCVPKLAEAALIERVGVRAPQCLEQAKDALAMVFFQADKIPIPKRVEGTLDPTTCPAGRLTHVGSH